MQKLSIGKYASNIQKYTDNVSEDAVTGIVKHLGIALTNQDASLVSCSDKIELDRIREGCLDARSLAKGLFLWVSRRIYKPRPFGDAGSHRYLKKKLQLTASNEDLDRAINEVCDKMKDTRNKSRVTFYYLLAEKFNKLSLF